ncbi:Carnosine N-methyltransferase [Metarhizium anisopliae]|nr:Carnosine N-methyltransferase [Metarhizium anisopliae]
MEFYNVGTSELKRHMADREAEGKHADKISVSQSLKHIVRDWASEGLNERNATFACLAGTLRRLFPDRNLLKEDVRILLPGAGLGRLGHDISQLGEFEVTVNEWSMYMNAVYRFIEAQNTALSQSVHPFVDGWSHHVSDDNMNRAVSFPDVPIDSSRVLMVEGDFTTEFKNQSAYYDVVLTYFFIDTARNLMSYLDTISHVLKKGGIWINLGPLLYGTSPFVQLSLEHIIAITKEMGFQFLETEDFCGEPTFSEPTVRSMEAVYSFDHMALTKNAYNAQFWAASKL